MSADEARVFLKLSIGKVVELTWSGKEASSQVLRVIAVDVEGFVSDVLNDSVSYNPTVQFWGPLDEIESIRVIDDHVSRPGNS